MKIASKEILLFFLQLVTIATTNGQLQLASTDDDHVLLHSKVFGEKDTLSTYKHEWKISGLGDRAVLTRSKNFHQPERAKIHVQFSGNVRFVLNYRQLSENYPNPNTKSGGGPNKVLNFNGWGDNNKLEGVPPFILLNAKVNPVPGTSVDVGFNFTHIFSGASGDSSRSIRPWNNFVGRAEITKPFGKFRIAAGNPFMEVGPLFGGFMPRRFMPFWRLPWDWYAEGGKDWSKYEDFYKGDNIGFDPNFIGNGRVRGFTLRGTDLPAGFRFGLIYGGTQSSIENPASTLFSSKQTFGASISKRLGNHSIGINGFFNNGNIDNISLLKEKQEIYSLDGALNFETINISGDIGLGGFKIPIGRWMDSNYTNIPYTSKLNEAIVIKALFSKKLIGIPLAFNFFSMGKDITSSTAVLNSGGYNTAYEIMNNNILWDLALYRGVITQTDQISNNRRGIILKTDFDIGRIKISLANQAAQEVENRYNVVTFQQRLNDYSRSTFRYWDAESGPYGRLLYQYITLYERIAITDSVINYKKTFNMLDLNIRYKTALFNKPLIVTNFTNYNSASDKLSPIPALNQSAFVRTFYNELMGYYQVSSKLSVIGHIGYQKNIANNRTELANNGKPISQSGWGLGTGLDYNFKEKAGLYLRYLYMTQEDSNFTLDKFKGHEVSLELKVFF